MRKRKSLLGKLGEDEAVKYLLELGFKILEKNFYSKFFEIDIIAEKNNILYFIEVKTRKSIKFGSGADTVNTIKIEKIKKGVEYYIHTRGVDMEVQVWGMFITMIGGIKRLEFLRII